MSKIQNTDCKPSDIAVVGLACWTPGNTKLWELLAEKRSAYTRVPKERYNVDAFHQKGTTHLNNLAADGAHFLDHDVSSFDAPFFGITAEEAKAMDPQARMLLECTYEALENAGLSVESVSGTDAGCWVGSFCRDYQDMLMGDVEAAPMYPGTGTGFSLLSNRISWYYNLKGPSISLDTACSSSLVGLHLACQSLALGESKMAMVCGVNLLLVPNLGLWLSNLGMLSSDGVSQSFAEDAKGYGRGEGIATVILKPLADALRDGDTVRAVIKATAINQDGHTKGITVPSTEAQYDLIRSVYRTACLDFGDTGYFEAHGTGTAVGDPRELAAVGQVIKECERKSPLYVGSVKSNVGHLEGAAGLAGLIKCILMLEKGMILPNIHFEKSNKLIPFGEYGIKIPTTLVPWPTDVSRRASVNSFGYGGTNAHVIVDAYPLDCDLQAGIGSVNARVQSKRLFVLSAHDTLALKEMRARYLKYVQEKGNATDAGFTFDDLAFTLGSRRSKLEWATAHVASGFKDLLEKLSDIESVGTSASRRPRIGFVFTGQGAQWPRMGHGLMQYEVFRESIQAADSFILHHPNGGWSVIEELDRPEGKSRIRTSEFGQPLCSIIQVAMVDLLRSWNIQPAGVVGHSSGEIGAAYCTGAITRQAAWEIAFHRGRVCASLKRHQPELEGTMLAVKLGAEAVNQYIEAFPPGRLNIACFNSPTSVTVSGDTSSIRELLNKLNVEKVFARELQVENAYHSHHMELLKEQYLASIAHIDPQKQVVSPGVQMVSSVTGQLTDPSELTPSYWVKNLRFPVKFSDAVSAMLKGSTRRFRRQRKTGTAAVDFLLEIGPHATLRGPIKEILQSEASQGVGYASVLIRDHEAAESAKIAAGEMYCHGASVDIAAVNGFQHKPRVLVDLPPYPWSRSKYWATSRLTNDFLNRDFPRHSLLGTRLLGSDSLHPAWRQFISLRDNSWIREHVVHRSIVYPGAGFLAMAIEAVLQLAERDRVVANVRMKNVRIIKALRITEEQNDPELIIRMRRINDDMDDGSLGWWEFSVSCTSGLSNPEEHAVGRVRLEYQPSEPYLNPASELVHEAQKTKYVRHLDSSVSTMERSVFYQASEDVGLSYGPQFQKIVTMSRKPNSCCWCIELPDTTTVTRDSWESKHLIHPTTLDAVVHSVFGAINTGDDFERAALPVTFDSIIISAQMPDADTKLSGFTVVSDTRGREIKADIYVSSVDWDQPLLQIEGLRCTELPLQKAALTAPEGESPLLGSVSWRPDIDLLDEQCLSSYMENSTFELGTEAETATFSNRLFSAVSKVISLAAFKNAKLSILQIGGYDRGLTNILLSTLETELRSPLPASKIVVLEPDLENLAQIEQDYGIQNSRINASYFDLNEPLSALRMEENSYDIVLVAVESLLDREIKTTLLKDARTLLKADGKLAVFDILRNIKDRPTLYGQEKTLEQSRGQLHMWKNLTIHGSEDQEAAALSTQRPSIAATEEVDSVFVIQPPRCTRKTAEVIESLSEALSYQGVTAIIAAWPPNIDDVKDKFVVSLLDMDRAFLCTLDAADFGVLRQVVLKGRRLLWVCPNSDPHMATAVGWLRVIQNENINKHYQHLTLEGGFQRSPQDISRVIAKVIRVQTLEKEFMEQDGMLNIPRWCYEPEMTLTVGKSEPSIRLETAFLKNAAATFPLRMTHGGVLDDAHFVPDVSYVSQLAQDEVEIDIKAIVITDRDVKHPGNDSMREASGIVRKVGCGVSSIHIGNRVCMSFFGRLSTRVVTREVFCQRIPSDVTMNEAACVPITFATAFRALVDIASVKPGQTVLVQAAGTRIGQATVLLAIAYQAEVYGTVRGKEERQRLVALGMPRNNLFVDSDPDLPAAIKALTKGRGLDIILRTARQEKTSCILSDCTAPLGALIDVHPVDEGTSDLQGKHSTHGYTIALVGIGLLLPEDPIHLQKTIQQALTYEPQLSKLENSAAWFSSDGVADALRQQQTQRDHHGVILSFNDEDRVTVDSSTKQSSHLDGKATYILAGGLGGLGRSLARLLVGHGARNLVFLSRAGPGSEAEKDITREMASFGVTVVAMTCDVGDEESVDRAVTECVRTMPPIRGVIQAAAVIRDAIFDNYTYGDWQANLRPKVQGSWNLHNSLPKDMDFFIMLSSVAGLIGNSNQAGYAAGNTFQDSLAHYRRRHHLPAVTIDLGPMHDVGVIKEGTTVANFSASGAVWMKEDDLHAIVTTCISGDRNSQIIPPQICTGLSSARMLQVSQSEAPLHFERPFFAHLGVLGTADEVAGEATVASLDKVCCWR